MTNIAFVMPDPALVQVVHDAWALHEKIFGNTAQTRKKDSKAIAFVI